MKRPEPAFIESHHNPGISIRITNKSVIALAMMVVTAMLIAACGDDDNAQGAESSAATPTGPSIDIGFINTENSPAGSYADVRQGAEAAVSYVNEELRGVNGRPIALDPCITNGSGESSIGCANGFVQEQKVAVIAGAGTLSAHCSTHGRALQAGTTH